MAYYYANHEKVKAKHSEYRRTHREQGKKISANWRRKNKKKVLLRDTMYRINNRERLRKYARDYYARKKLK